MKATGITRKVDQLGRIVIPKEIRKLYKINEGDPLEVFIGKNGEIILKQYFDTEDKLKIFKSDIIDKLKNLEVNDVKKVTKIIESEYKKYIII